MAPTPPLLRSLRLRTCRCDGHCPTAARNRSARSRPSLENNDASPLPTPGRGRQAYPPGRQPPPGTADPLLPETRGPLPRPAPLITKTAWPTRHPNAVSVPARSLPRLRKSRPRSSFAELLAVDRPNLEGSPGSVPRPRGSLRPQSLLQPIGSTLSPLPMFPRPLPAPAPSPPRPGGRPPGTWPTLRRG
jgi:hypothetical protein